MGVMAVGALPEALAEAPNDPLDQAIQHFNNLEEAEAETELRGVA